MLPRLVWHSLDLLAFSAQPALARGAADFEASVLRATVEALERSGALPPAEAALLVLVQSLGASLTSIFQTRPCTRLLNTDCA